MKRMPSDRAGETTPPDQTQPFATRGVRLRVLVIDDEPLITRMLIKTLSKEHDAVAELHAEPALERISGGERYDVIFCDMTMPDVDGLTFLERAEQIDPALVGRIVIMTGGLSEEASAALSGRRVTRLDKPFDLSQVRSTVAGFRARPAE